jgi:hypothetical protein
MPGILERIAKTIGALHARRVLARFYRAAENVERSQQRALDQALALVRGGEFAARNGLRSVRSLDELRRAVPLHTYEDMRPYFDRVWEGDVGALFSPSQRILMFAKSSGTTSLPKRIPVTPPFVRDYRRGWNAFGIKVLADHPGNFLRAILQSTGRMDECYSPMGVPCGAITGLLARMQKRIVRRFYVGREEIARIDDSRARYYTLMRFAVGRDVAWAITANPATLIRLAQVADEETESLIRDIRDGDLAHRYVPDAPLRRRLLHGSRPDPARARQLESLRAVHGTLRPRDYWRLGFLACWTGGSMAHYLDRLAEWYGPIPVRDIGLLASEGRVSTPLEDGTPAGVLDVESACFEFIPAEAVGKPNPETVDPLVLQAGRDYAVVMTNAAGLVRYRLEDVVRAHGHVGMAPVVEFLYRAGRVSSVAGEKLTENQVVSAIRATCKRLSIPEFDFVVAPTWNDPPLYRVTCGAALPAEFGAFFDRALSDQNDEYASRRSSARLGAPIIRSVSTSLIAEMDRRLIAARSSASEQYKRPCLLTDVGADDAALGL